MSVLSDKLSHHTKDYHKKKLIFDYYLSYIFSAHKIQRPFIIKLVFVGVSVGGTKFLANARLRHRNLFQNIQNNVFNTMKQHINWGVLVVVVVVVAAADNIIIYNRRMGRIHYIVWLYGKLFFRVPARL